LQESINLLEKNSIIFVISFHSLEDRIVKNIFRNESRDCICNDIICSCKHKKNLEILSKKPILPTENEIKINSRSRSAKARIAKKI
jgi:16S rRNA (cytosine1402-N4)-methyltransferase